DYIGYRTAGMATAGIMPPSPSCYLKADPGRAGIYVPSASAFRYAHGAQSGVRESPVPIRLGLSRLQLEHRARGFACRLPRKLNEVARKRRIVRYTTYCIRDRSLLGCGLDLLRSPERAANDCHSF